MQKKRKGLADNPPTAGTRLNKFISNAGVCARREADTLIQSGYITVNNQKVVTLGYQVKPGDIVKYRGKTLQANKPIYILLNKPKDCITTAKDPVGRMTVLDLVKNACSERVYPVGRLDRNTTGLLVLTNDGELAQKLAHPSSLVKKLYQIELNRTLQMKDLAAIQAGVMLEDGIVQVDDVAIIAADKKSVGIELHMGRNRIIRRLFEHLGYEVVKLDRVMYANLTKKDLPRGKWRFLKPQEISQLKQLAAKS
jgi:23S rRNA pseudouridine2605 synthase